MAGTVSSAALVDVIVAMVAVPLLVIFSLLLETNMRGDWTANDEARWNVLGLGLALLVVSLLVCCYVIHRLGICFWEAQNRGSAPRSAGATGQTAGSTDSQLNLFDGSELPPSYESVQELPPSYFVIMNTDKEKVEKIPTVSMSVTAAT